MTSVQVVSPSCGNKKMHSSELELFMNYFQIQEKDLELVPVSRNFDLKGSCFIGSKKIDFFFINQYNYQYNFSRIYS